MERRPHDNTFRAVPLLPALIAAALWIGTGTAAADPPALSLTTPGLTAPNPLATAADLANQVVQATAHTDAATVPCPNAPPPLSVATQAACDRWNEQLQPVQPFNLLTTEPADAAKAAQANLHALALNNAKLEIGAACIQGRVPTLAAPHYRQGFYRNPDHQLTMTQMLGYFQTLSPASVNNMLTEYRDLKKFRPDSDAALIAAISFRESGYLAWSKSDERINTHESGGLDFLGTFLGTIRARYLPHGYGHEWKIDLKSMNESGDSNSPGRLPQKDLPMAYGAWLLYSKDSFEREALKHGFTQGDLDHLSPDARRAWIATFFAASGGVEYGKPHSNDAHQIGGITVLTHLKALIEKKQAAHQETHGLNDILSSPELYQYTNVRAGMAVVGNASLLERTLGLQ